MGRLLLIILSLTASIFIIFTLGGIIQNGSDNALAQQILLGNNAEGLSQLLAEKQTLNQALANAAKVKEKIASLEQAQKSISPEDLAKLDKFIPDHIDNINLIIDVNNIALSNGMTIKGVRVRSGGDSVSGSGGVGSEEVASAQDKIAETYVSFSVSGSYDDLLKFLDSLANSLRVADVTSLSFSVDDKGNNQYNFEIKTYWVK